MMRSKVFLVSCLFIVAFGAYSQENADLWKSIMKVEDNRYIINLPDTWKKVTIADGSGLDYKYDFSGVGIPATANGSPMYGFFTVARIPGQKEKQAREQVLMDFTAFYDRVTEPGYNYDTAVATIKSGQTGMLLHTRYYRRSKVSNYSKYYLIVYSPKTDDTFLLTVNFQYKDPSYDIERSAHLKDYVTDIFGHFEFR
jgi:hypothetical protein